MEVFDKVTWHTDNGMQIEDAKKHIFAIILFMSSNNLLSEEGSNIFNKDGIDIEFSLNSELLNSEGNRFMKKNYKSYLKDVVKNGIPEAIKTLQQKYQVSQIKVPKEKGFLYDSIDAHWSKSKNSKYEEYVNVNYYFKYLLNWLSTKKLLKEEAKKYLDVELLPEKFELRSWMLNDIANKKLPPVYDKWLRQVKLGQKDIKMDILENAIG